MQNNELLKLGESVIRVLDIRTGQAFIVDCRNKTMPKWVDMERLSDYAACSEEEVAISHI